MAAPDPYEEAGFNSQRHRYEDAYDIGLRKNNMQVATATQGKIDQLAKLRLGFTRGEGAFRSGYAMRGLRNSGLFTQGLGDRAQDYAQQTTEIERNFNLHRLGLETERQGLWQQRQRGVWDTEMERLARRQSLASQIRA